MNKRTFFAWSIGAASMLGLLAACTRPLPGPNLQAATATPTRPFMTLPTATNIPPTQPLPTQVSPAAPTPTLPAPTPMPSPTPVATLVGPAPTPVQVQGLEPVALDLDLPNKYKLKKGEFPFCIARRYDVDPYELLRHNGLAVDRVFYQGQVFRFPNNPDPFPWERELKRHPAEYKVRRGDTIYTIACLFGDVDPLMIAEVNGLTSPFRLKVGRVLQIP